MPEHTTSIAIQYINFIRKIILRLILQNDSHSSQKNILFFWPSIGLKIGKKVIFSAINHKLKFYSISTHTISLFKNCVFDSVDLTAASLYYRSPCCTDYINIWPSVDYVISPGPKSSWFPFLGSRWTQRTLGHHGKHGQSHESDLKGR